MLKRIAQAILALAEIKSLCLDTNMIERPETTQRARLLLVRDPTPFNKRLSPPTQPRHGSPE